MSLSVGIAMWPSRASDSLRTLDCSQGLVECPQWTMTRGSGGFKNHAIRELDGFVRSIVPKCGCDRSGILKPQGFMVQQHFHRRRQFPVAQSIDRGEHPSGLDQDHMRYPRTLAHEFFRPRRLACIIPDQQANQHIGVNRAHASSASGPGCPGPYSLRMIQLASRGKWRHGCLDRYDLPPAER